jgi:putative membrane protein
MNPLIAKTCRFAGALAAAVSLCAVLSAQVEPTPTPQPTTLPAPTPVPDTQESGTVSHHDKAFLKKAAKAGMKEVAVSQAVMGNLANPQVKDFAEKMIADHTAANIELANLAATKGVQLPPQDPDIYTDWSKKTDDVDKKYVKEMLSDHNDAVKLFKKASESKDPEIAAFAQRTLPTLEHHLMMVQALDKAIN